MNYEKKYKSALEWMRSIYPTMQGSDKEDAEHFFPELRESEDEKIRKMLITFVKNDSIIASNKNKQDALAWLEKQSEQKPTAWSEEDERMISGLISIVEGWYNTMSEEEKEYYGDCGYINWLNSFKDRVQHQPKQDWSEDDSWMLNVCCNAIDSYKEPVDKYLVKKWLKSLKPNHWKPSEEQMEGMQK